MNTNIITYILLFCTISLFAQNEQIESAASFSEVLPASPSAKSMTVSSDVGVDRSTGALNISIPLYTLSQNGFSIPISASYATNGIRVDQVASNIGLGWSLNAGGVISRTIISKDDFDYNQGWLNNDYNPNVSPQPTTDWSQLDFDPDLFSYNFGGYSGKFVYNRAGEIVQLNKSAIKFNKIPGFPHDTWEAVDPKGIKYYFKKIEYSTNSNNDAVTSNGITAWYLTRINHPNGEYAIINYKTNREIPELTYISSRSYSFSVQSGCQGAPSCSSLPTSLVENILPISSQNSFTSNENIQISSIITNNERALFSYSQAEKNNGVEGQVKLNNISILRNGTSYRTFSFTYDHFYNDRLILKQISESGPSAGLPPYKFNYLHELSNIYKLPSRLSNAQDHWGYYNKKETNATLLPKIEGDNHTNSPHFGNREAHPEGAISGLLYKVQNPLGLNYEITYEPHDYNYISEGGFTPNYSTYEDYESACFGCQDVVNTLCGLPLLQDEIQTFPFTLDFDQTISFDWRNYFPQIPGEFSGTIKILDSSGNLIQSFGLTGLNGNSATLALNEGNYLVVLEAELGYCCMSYFLTYQKYELDDNGNPIFGPFLAGGARVKEIKDNDGTMSFSYKDINAHSSGRLNAPLIYSYNFQQAVLEDCDLSCPTCKMKTIVSSNLFNGMVTKGSHIMYKDVQVTNKDGSLELDNYSYKGDSGAAGFPLPQITSHEYGRGHLESRKIFNDSGKLVQEITNEYSYREDSGDNLNIVTGYAVSHNPANPSCSSINPVINNPYHHYSKWVTLDNTSTKTFALDGSSFVETITSNSYTNLYYNLISQEISGPQTTKLIENKYANDLSNSVLISKNMVSVPLETTVNGGHGGGTKIEFNNSYTQLLPTKYYSANIDGSWKELVSLNYTNGDSYPDEIQRNTQAQPEILTWGSGPNYGLVMSKSYGARNWTYSYNNLRQLTSQTDHQGITSNYTYDGLGRLSQMVALNGRQTSDYDYVYGLASGGENLFNTTISYSDGTSSLSTSQTLDGFGRMIKQTIPGYFQDGSDYVLTQSYDAAGRVIATNDPLTGGTTSSSYENSPLNRMISTTPAGSTKSILMDYLVIENQMAVKTTDENGNSSITINDAFSRQLKQINGFGALNLTTSYQYDDRDQVTQINPPSGSPYTYTYYSDGLLASKTIPDKGTYNYQYNNFDQIAIEDLPNGTQLIHDYDPIYNDFLLTSSAGSQVIKSFVQDGVSGRVKNAESKMMNNPGYATSSFVYDDIGRVSINTINASLDGLSSIVQLNYDDAGNVLQEKTNVNGFGPTTTSVKDFAYDKGLRLESTTAKINGQATTLNALSYNNNDYLTQKIIGNGIQQIDYQYNPRGWLTKINSVDATYDEDPCGPILPEDDCEDLFDFGHGDDDKRITQLSVAFNCTEIDQQIPTYIELTSRDQTFNNQGTERVFTAGLFGWQAGTDNALPNQFEVIINYNNNDEEQILTYIVEQIILCLENDQHPPQLADIMYHEIQNALQASSGPQPAAPLFGMEIFYDKGNAALSAPPQYNGNISWMKWRVKGEDQMAYGFTYDPVDLLRKANYGKFSTEECEL